MLCLSVPITGKAQEVDHIAALNKAENYLRSKIVDPAVGKTGGEWAVIAMAREGRLTERARTEYLKNLQYVLQQKKGVLHTTEYMEYSRTILALTAIGTDPKKVNGYDVLAPLGDFNSVTKQGVQGAVYALIALDSRNYDVPKLPSDEKNKIQTTRERLVDYILEAELKDGGWGLLDTPDDVTPMVIQCLAPYQKRKDVKEALQRTVQKLSTAQEADGGFSKKGGSTLIAQTIVALCTYDASLLTSEAFVKNGHTLLEALLAYQNENGAFSSILGKGEEMLATEQGALALCAYRRAMDHKNPLFDMTDVKVRTDLPELEYIPGQQGNSSSAVIPGLNGELAVQGTKPQNSGAGSAGTAGTGTPGIGGSSSGAGIIAPSHSKQESAKNKVASKKKKNSIKDTIKEEAKKKDKTTKSTKKTEKKTAKKTEKKKDQLKKKNHNKKETDKIINPRGEKKSYAPIIWGIVIGGFVVACIITKIVLEVKRKKRRMRWRSNSKR